MEISTYVEAAFVIIGALVVIAGVVVKFTKNTKDDEIVEKIKEVVAPFTKDDEEPKS